MRKYSIVKFHQDILFSEFEFSVDCRTVFELSCGMVRSPIESGLWSSNWIRDVCMGKYVAFGRNNQEAGCRRAKWNRNLIQCRYAWWALAVKILVQTWVKSAQSMMKLRSLTAAWASLQYLPALSYGFTNVTAHVITASLTYSVTTGSFKAPWVRRPWPQTTAVTPCDVISWSSSHQIVQHCEVHFSLPTWVLGSTETFNSEVEF